MQCSLGLLEEEWFEIGSQRHSCLCCCGHHGEVPNGNGVKDRWLCRHHIPGQREGDKGEGGGRVRLRARMRVGLG